MPVVIALKKSKNANIIVQRLKKVVLLLQLIATVNVLANWKTDGDAWNTIP